MTRVTDLVRLEYGAASCAVSPDLGGSLLSWNIHGQNMLREASADALTAGDPLGLASFPLVPYSNRIANGSFVWLGKQIQLTKNFPPEPHSIHGTGWTDAWTISERTMHQCTLALDHAGDDRWPWPFVATQKITLEDEVLEIALCVQNASSETVPLAFGHHPYFDQAGARLTFGAEQVWMSGETGLPTTAMPPSGIFDFASGAAVAGRSVDHCYAGWTGRARIDWAGRPYALEITSDMRAAVVYIPAAGTAFCFEPVPHINNALNLPGQEPAMPAIAAGKEYRSAIRFQAFNTQAA